MPPPDYFTGSSIGLLPSAPIVSVTYRGGLRCDYTVNGPSSKACATPPGYREPAIPDYTHAEVASSVEATAHHSKQLGWSYSVSFIARAAVTNDLSAYVVGLSLPGGCATGSEYPVNVTSGQRITLSLRQLPAHAGRYHGAVYFVSNPRGGPIGFAGLGAHGPGRRVLVGSFTLAVPPHYTRPGTVSGCS